MTKADGDQNRKRQTRLDSTLFLDDAQVPAAAGETTPDFAPGTIINQRYRVEECLGKGGMGVVYRVHDPMNPDRQVALKSILRQATQPARLDRFEAEFRTLTELLHPNIAAAYDFEPLHGTDDCFFTMEFVDGSDILKATENADWKHVVDHVVQVCRALSYVHSRKIIHYDIKPGNVLVDQAGRAKVLDFGLAATKPIGPAASSAGTPLYMAPEMADPETFVDHRIDLYSLGALTFELLCRRSLFPARSWPELLEMHRTQRPEFNEAEKESVPQWLRSIVRRLCARYAADRYPTANAVIDDINRRGGMSHELETGETKQSYVSSSRFVDRTLEYGRVSDFVSRRTRGAPGLPPVLAVRGQSGTGKSRMLREIRHDTQLSRVLFCQGRCFEGSFSAFEPLAPALEILIRYADGLGGEDLLCHYGPELTKICPRLAKTRGIEPSLPLGQVHKEQARLREAVTDFLFRVADLGPFVLCFDDLQWALADLTELLTTLAGRIAVGERRGTAVPVAILGSYRDEEIAGRPAEAMRDLMRSAGNLEEIRLEPLGAADVSEMVGSMLGASELPEAFVDRLARETDGNPFFVEELMRSLVEDGIVDLAGGSWKVRRRIGEIVMPSTVAAVFRRRAAMLDRDQRRLIEVLAVCGRPTAADVLMESTRLDVARMHSALGHLVEQRVVQEVPGPGLLFRLSHDRLRETVRDDLEPVARERLHLTVARAMEHVWERELEEHALDIADHYNGAAKSLVEAEDVEKAIRYNELAGFRSKGFGSFEAAGAYLRSAMSFLSADSWSTDYDRVAGISRTLMDVEYLGKDLTRAERHWQQHVSMTRSNLEKAEAYGVKANALTHLGRLNEALATIDEALPFLGARYPTRPGKPSVARELLRTWWILRKHSPEDLLALEELSSDEQHVLLALLSSAIPPAFITYREDLFCYYAMRGVQITATWGNDPMTAFMYASYAFVRQQALGDLAGARTLGDVALALARKCGDPFAAGRALFMVAAFLFPWTRPLQELQDLLLEGHQLSLRGGDLLFAGFLLNVAITQQCMYSPSVEGTLQFIEDHEDFLIRLGNPHTMVEIAALRQMLFYLSGKTTHEATFDDGTFDEKTFRRDLIELDDRISAGFYLAFRLKAFFVMGLYDDAYAFSVEADRRVAATRGQFVYGEHAFFHALTLARRWSSAGPLAKFRLRRGIEAKKRLLAKWSASCPENFDHKLLLVDAELARLRGDAHSARDLYRKARASAGEAGFPLNATLASELAGRFELEQGNAKNARVQLAAARDGYKSWGALAKVEKLDAELSG
ncbi:MAG: protein kinase [Acidobacteriota bacterium]|nr:protein kinase [Acidobacteriota bacterium]